MIFYKEKFKARRLQLRYTVTELAKLCGVVKATVSRWERGVNIPPKAYVKILADILNVSVSEISDLPEDKQNAFIDGIKDVNTLAISNERQLDQEEEDFITGVKRQKEQLKKAKLVINSLMNTMHSAFYIKGGTGEYVFANNDFLKITQKTDTPNIEGKDDYYFFPKNEAIQNTKLDQKVLEQRERIVNRQTHIPGTRKKKWGLVTKVPIINDEDKVEGMLCTIKDITIEKQANELNEELKSAISNIQDVVWTGVIIDYKLKYTTVNDATEKLLGLSKLQFLHGEWTQYVHPDFLNNVEQFLKDTKTTPRQIEYKYVHPQTNKTLWFQSRINIDGQHHFGIIRDITKEKEQANLQKMILQSFKSFNIGFSIENINTKQMKLENAFPNNLFGIPTNIPLHKMTEYWLNNIVHPDDREEQIRIDKSGEVIPRRKYRIIHPAKGVRWIEVHRRKINFKEEEFAISFIVDITNETNPGKV